MPSSPTLSGRRVGAGVSVGVGVSVGGVSVAVGVGGGVVGVAVAGGAVTSAPAAGVTVGCAGVAQAASIPMSRARTIRLSRRCFLNMVASFGAGRARRGWAVVRTSAYSTGKCPVISRLRQN